MDYKEQYIILNRNLHDSDSKDKIDAIINILPRDFRAESILDVACGSGKILIEISQILHSKNNIGLDISKKAINIAKNNDEESKIKWIISDIFEYNHGNFDLVLAIDIIEHLEDDKLFLNNLLKLGKFFVMKVPIEHNYINNIVMLLSNKKINPLKETELRYGHIQHYSFRSFMALVQGSSSKILKVDYLHLPRRSSFFWEILRWIFLPVWFLSKNFYIRLNGGFVVLLLKSDIYDGKY